MKTTLNASAKREIESYATTIVENFDRSSEFLESRDPREHVEYALENFPCDELRVSPGRAYDEILKLVRKKLAR